MGTTRAVGKEVPGCNHITMGSRWHDQDAKRLAYRASIAVRWFRTLEASHICIEKFAAADVSAHVPWH